MALLEVRNLKTHFFMRKATVKAVHDVSFEVERGETVGLAGESGCGKSTTAYSIMGMVPSPGRVVGGEIIFKGRNIANLPEKQMKKIRWKEISIVFQGAMNALNPVMSVGEQISEALMLHQNMVKQTAMKEVHRLLNRVGLPAKISESYPFELSGGMKQRTMIAMALANKPELVITDEPTTALDVTMQAQMLELLNDLKEEYGMSLIFITHDLSVLAETCDKIAIMYAGKIMEYGETVDIFTRPIHPYTKGLVQAVPTIEAGKSKALFSIPGNPPDLTDPPSGCEFHPRCVYAQDICSQEEPHENVPGRGFVYCHFADELKDVPPRELWKEKIEVV